MDGWMDGTIDWLVCWFCNDTVEANVHNQFGQIFNPGAISPSLKVR
jgi:hypothetical protein